MKDGFVLFVIIVVAIGGIALWAGRADFGHLFQSPAAAPVQVQDPQPVKAATPPPKPKKIAKAEPKKVVEEPVAIAAQAEVVPAPAPVAAPPPPPRPFPSVEEIALGAEENNITDTFGDPVLSATTSHEGHVTETLVYSRNSGRAVTVIYLEDGKVSSAYSRSGSIPMVGTPLPRRQKGG